MTLSFITIKDKKYECHLPVFNSLDTALDAITVKLL